MVNNESCRVLKSAPTIRSTRTSRSFVAFRGNRRGWLKGHSRALLRAASFPLQCECIGLVLLTDRELDVLFCEPIGFEDEVQLFARLAFDAKWCGPHFFSAFIYICVPF